METKLLNYTIEQAEYPAYPRFVNPEDYYKADGGWDHAAYNKAEEDYRQALLSMGKGEAAGEAGALAFADKTAGRVLLSRGGENGVYSPVSLYTAMVMLAEVCAGKSREEVLFAMGAADLEALRDAVHQLWINSYCDSGVVTSRMGSSLWLNEQVSYCEETLKTLAENYFASSYRVAMGTDEAGLSHPDWEENLSLALKLHARLEQQCPGIMRPLILRSQRFNQDMSPGALLVEVGAAGNTHDEALAAAEQLAEAIAALTLGTQ